MFVPLHDANPLRFVHFQYVTVAIIAVNVAIFAALQLSSVGEAITESALGYGVIPAVLLDQQELSPELVRVPEQVTLITYMFLHGGWLHLLGNMLFLWVFGDNVEDATGHVRFLVFYLLCGIAAGLAHAYAMPASDLPLVGASGAVAGVIAAYLMLHPHVKVWVLVLWRIPLRISAAWALGFWVAMQVVSVMIDTEENIAWWAHIGGLAAGAVLITVFKRRDVPLFDRGMDLTGQPDSNT